MAYIYDTLEFIAKLGPAKGKAAASVIRRLFESDSFNQSANIDAQLAAFVVRHNNYGKAVVELANKKGIELIDAHELMLNDNKYWFNSYIYCYFDYVADMIDDEIESMF